jgi:prepilin-type N-terminal cleavage/methylation domain-containing protein
MLEASSKHNLPLAATKNIHGFSMIELVFVIMVIAILARYALISYQPLPIEVSAMAQQVASDIRYSQSLSMCKGVRYHLTSTGTNTYQISDASGTPITFAMGGTTQTMGGGIFFNGAANLPNNLIAFDGWGAPYVDTANTSLTSAAVITLTSGTQSQTVTIQPITGLVTVP